MAALPEIDPLKQQLDLKKVPQLLRPYLGYSVYGHDCARYLFYTFRWCYSKEITKQQERLFSRGDQEEFVVVRELKEIGVICHNVLDAQIEVVGSFGHLRGHPDGDADNIPGAEKTTHNLEIKTANEKKWAEFKRFGVQRSNPVYYLQAQAYMHHKQQTRTLFVITNKNTDERHYERIHRDDKAFLDAEERAVDIIMSDRPPRKLAEEPEFYQCKWCDAYAVCHQGQQVERNCRTCQNARIKDGGEWHCAVYPGKPIPVEFQRTGCANEYRPFL